MIIRRALVKFFDFCYISLTQVDLLAYGIGISELRDDGVKALTLGEGSLRVVHDGVVVILLPVPGSPPVNKIKVQ